MTLFNNQLNILSKGILISGVLSLIACTAHEARIETAPVVAEVKKPTTFELFQKSAANGNIVDQFNVGQMYENGLGVTRDIYRAYLWYSLAYQHGSDDARWAIEDRVDKELTAEQKAEAKQAVSKWKKGEVF